MTKENYLLYDKTKNIFCESCLKSKPVSSFAYSRIKTGTRIATRCRTCEWIYRNKNKFNNIVISDTIKCVIEFLLEDSDKHIETLANIINKSVDETYEIIKQLHLTNVRLTSMCTCEFCGENFYKVISAKIKSKNLYCSYECYWNDKTNKVPHNKESVFYNRIETTCSNCGKKIFVIPYRYNKVNSYGDNNNFCSRECYSEFRSKYYVDDKSGMKNYQFSEEQKEKRRIYLLNKMKSEDRLNTKIQVLINGVLDRNNIKYSREYSMKYYSVDNYLIEHNLIIEVMGGLLAYKS